MIVGSPMPEPDSREARRLSVLRATGLLDTDAEAAFDRLTRLSSRLLGAPAALVSLVDDHRDFFKSAVGLAEPWASRRETPLSHSICQHVARSAEPLVVSDTRRHPLLRDNPGVRDLNVVAYAGVPLTVDGEAIGAFCVIDDHPRDWSAENIQLLKDLAASVASEVQLRSALRESHRQKALLDAVVDSIGDGCIAIDAERTFILVNRQARRLFEGATVGAKVPPGWSRMHRSRRLDGSPMLSEHGPLGRALQGESVDRLAFTLQRPGADTAIWVEARSRPVHGDDGQVIAAVAAYRDVTEEKIERERFAALVANIPNAAVALFDGELRCLALDGGLLRAPGRPSSSFAGQTLRQLAGLAPGDPVFDPIERICRQALEGQGHSIDLQLSGRTFAVHAAPVREQPEAGAGATGIVLALDVTHERALEKSLRQSEQIHRAIVQHLPLGAVFMMDADMRYVSADGPLLASLMRQGEVTELVGKRAPEIASQANRERLIAFYGKALAGQRQYMELAYADRWYELSAVPIFDGDTVTHAVVVLYDVTPRKQEAETLRRARDEVARERGLLEAALAHIEDGMVLLDDQRRILLANASFAAMFSLQQETLTGMSRQTFVEWVSPVAEDPESFQRVMLGTDQPEPQEFVFLRPRRRVLKRSLTSVRLGAGEGYLVTWHDVTAERDLLRERERLLLVDALTGVPNRRALETALHIEAERMKRTGTPFCVALLDVDHFKRVNDVHGHGAGDEVLRAVGGTLSAQIRVTDTAGRWGGEEFLALLNGTLSGALVFGERTRAAIEKLRCPPVERITISIGLAEVQPGESVVDAVARADKRLYEAKAGGRNRVCG